MLEGSIFVGGTAKTGSVPVIPQAWVVILVAAMVGLSAATKAAMAAGRVTAMVGLSGVE